MNRPILTSVLVAAGVAGAALVPVVTSDQPARLPVAAQASVLPQPVDLAPDARDAAVAAQRALVQRQLRAERAKAAADERARVIALAKERRERALRRASRERRATVAVTYGSPRAIARSMLAQRGWSDQFGCLDRLWQKESGWRVTASNPSGAYGIPQALPGSKMASAGADWRTNPATQIRWGLGYIGSRYGGPCAAEAHARSTGWY